MTKTTKRKPSISIIGAGRLGQALGLALAAAGHSIVALVARKASHARKAAAELSQPVLALGSKQLDRLPSSDLILLTTPDDAIEDVARRLAASESRQTRRRTVLHTSGALSSAVLSSLRDVGFHTGSLHPLVSISDPETGAKALQGAFYCLEGDTVAMRMARLMVRDLKGQSFSIRPEHKALYHAAALTAAGHLTALVDLSMEMLGECGLSRPVARKVLMPLVESAIRNLKVASPEKALTGTFARGDLATVKRHLQVLARAEIPESAEVYKLLGLRSLQLAEKNGLDPKIVNQIRKALKNTKTRRT